MIGREAMFEARAELQRIKKKRRKENEKQG